MLGGHLVSSFRRRNEVLNSIRFPPAEDGPWRLYRELIEEYRAGASIVLDLGAGPIDAREEWLSNGHASSKVHSPVVLSLDQDLESLRRNPGQCRVVADARRLPFREDSVDLVLSRYTLEHLPNPLPMIEEAARVLKPGRALVFVTPHRWCYVSLVSRLTPVWFHRLIYRLLGHSGHQLPFCPTYYRLNTPSEISARASEVGFEVSRLSITVGPPEYTKIFPPLLHRVFVWLHSQLERRPRLRYHFGVNLFGVLQKRLTSARPAPPPA